MSPETIQRRKVSKYNDVWSYGVTCWEIYTFGLLPYLEKVDNDSVASFVVGGGRLQKPVNCDARIWSLIHSCWKPVATERPSFGQLMEEMLNAMNPLYRKKNVDQPDVYVSSGSGAFAFKVNGNVESSSAQPTRTTQASSSSSSSSEGAQQGLNWNEGGGSMSMSMSMRGLPALPVKKVSASESLSVLAMSIYDYQAESMQELSFAQGESLVILEKNEDGWWLAKNSIGSVGLVPCNYLNLS
jgi:serine/threonine protein kinase